MKRYIAIAVLFLICGVSFAYQSANVSKSKSTIGLQKKDIELKEKLVANIELSIDDATRNGKFEAEVDVSEFSLPLIQFEMNSLIDDGYKVKYVEGRTFGVDHEMLIIKW